MTLPISVDEETVHMQYLGSLVFNAGFVCYVWLTIMSLRQLACLPPSNSTRRLLLPYTLALFLINSIFAILQNIFLEKLVVQQTDTWGCEPGKTIRAFFSTIPIFANDLLFLYRAAVLVSWQKRILAFPVVLYIASFGMGTFALVDYLNNECFSEDGLPSLIIITVIMTALLNLILGIVIIWKLILSQRAARSLAAKNTTHSPGMQHRYMRTTRFIAESSLLWIIAGALYAGSVIGDTAVSAFFELLFEITVMLSPVLLTYHVSLENIPKN